MLQSKGNRRIEVNPTLNRHKETVRQLLTSEEGFYHRSRRPVEPEAVFGQGKFNKQYFRFRHFGKYMITMDFAIFAIAFNLGKLLAKGKKYAPKQAKSSLLSEILVFVVVGYAKYEFTTLRQEYFYSENLKLAA
jgi:hypothetical protein